MADTRLHIEVAQFVCFQTLTVGAFGNAFNNLSLHTFSSYKLPGQDDTFWKEPFSAPPDDDEVIGKLIAPCGE